MSTLDCSRYMAAVWHTTCGEMRLPVGLGRIFSLIGDLLEDVIDPVVRQFPAVMTWKRDRRASALQFVEPRLQFLGRV